MVRQFASFEWKQFFRSPYWQKSIAIKVLLVFFALYFVVVFLALGVSLFPLLKEFFPETDPFVKLNGFVYFWVLADLMARFFMQKLPMMNVKPMLVLPIRKRKIVHYILGKSVISFFNFLPLFAVIPFGVVLMVEGYDTSVAVTWMVLMYTFSLTVNFLNFIIESKSADTELSFLPIIALGAVLFSVDYFEILSLSDMLASAILAIAENPLLLVIPIGLLAGLYVLNFRQLWQKLYIDESLKTKTMTATTSEMAWTRRFGDIAPFMQLDLKLLWRNKRPRSSIFILVIGLLYGLFFYPNPIYREMIPLFVFVGIFVTGIFIINFGQFIPAWDSAYYKLLMSQNIKYKEYLNSKFSLMVISAIVMFILSIPYVYFGWKILAIHFAAMVYNLGVNTYVLLFAGSFNRKRIDLSQRAAFNYQGTGAVQWLIGIPLLAIPVLFFYIPYAFMGFEAGVITLVVLGGLGIVFHHRLMKAITGRYLRSKHEMISAFDQTN
jgi:hypothetical protein